MNKITLDTLLVLGIISTSVYLALFIVFLDSDLDVKTHDKPCIGIGKHCTYYTDKQECRIGSDYLICNDKI